MKKQISALAASLIGLTMSTTLSAGHNCGMKNSNYHMQQAQYPHHHARMIYAAHHSAAMHGGYSKDKSAGYGTYSSKTAGNAGPNIVEVASSAGSFNTLIAAVKAAGLVDTLTGKGPFTVFAPTDEAFAKLPEGTLEALLADKDKLTQILTYHVVPGKVNAEAVSGVSKLSTVQGNELPVADIKIAKTDIKASNGVIHVIDEVLIPDA
jgi:uncharacterized surface protein with fasciclin (FAS1) repeats